MNVIGYKILSTVLSVVACVVGFISIVAIFCGPSVDISIGRDPSRLQKMAIAGLIVSMLCLIGRFFLRRYLKTDSEKECQQKL
jgi:hypothetical protein